MSSGLEAQRVLSVDDACDVIVEWFGWGDDLGGAALTLRFKPPAAVEALNRRLGRLWIDSARGHLFDSQDRLISPHGYEVEPDGVVPVIWENQGVWGCGFKPETGSDLWVLGDWPDGRRGTRGWRRTPDVIDTPVIFALLSNAIWATEDCEMDEADEKPEWADRLLWTFAPTSGFAGFWTDADRASLRMQGAGWGVTARR